MPPEDKEVHNVVVALISQPFRLIALCAGTDFIRDVEIVLFQPAEQKT